MSTFNQARHIVDKLRLIDCGIAPKDSGQSFLLSLNDDEIEYLSIIEHDRWVNERVSSGWVYGEIKDSEKRVSPYLVEWDGLTEDVKELDRNVVRNMIPLLDKVGLGVYRTEEPKER